MTRVLEIPVSSGGPLMRVEVDDTLAATREGPRLRGGPGPIEKITKAGVSFDAILDGIKPSILAMYQNLNSLGPILDSVEVAFSIKVTADVGVIFAKASTEGNFQITLSFKPAKAKP